MDALNARPTILKQANLSRLRKALKVLGTATRAQLVQKTKISPTTVRSLLVEMLRDGEVESAGYGDSSGGRKAERYRFAPDRYYGAAVCIGGGEARGLLVDLCGNVAACEPLAGAGGDLERLVTSFLDRAVGQKQIKAIGVGVPGIVEGGCFWRQEKGQEDLRRVPLGDALARRYGVPVVLENDLNATTLGFGRCYGREFPAEDPENTHMAYVYFEEGCVSAGFLAGGRVLRGAHNFAGELGLVPRGEASVDAWLAAAGDDARYTARVIELLGWVCGILNPQYIALGGPALRKGCMGPIGDGLAALLPGPLVPELLYAADMWHDYQDGMAVLTAARMFDEVQFIKE